MAREWNGKHLNSDEVNRGHPGMGSLGHWPEHFLEKNHRKLIQ